MANLNWVAILGAALAGFVFSALFNAFLAKSAGRSAFPAVALIVLLIAQIVMALVLAGVLAHTAKSGVTMRAGAIVAAICWLGFVLATIVATHARDKIRPLQTLAESGHWLGVLLVQGLALGALL
jgi:hypothetical protein